MRRNGRAAEPIILSPTVEQLRSDFPRMISLNLTDRDSGLDIVVIVAMEMLKRIAASLRAKKAEVNAGAQSAQTRLLSLLRGHSLFPRSPRFSEWRRGKDCLLWR